MIEKHTHLKSYEFTEEEIIRGNLLSPDTFAKLQNRLTELVLQSMELSFRGNADERIEAMLRHASITGARECIQQLLDEAVAAYNHLPEAPTSNAP